MIRMKQMIMLGTLGISLSACNWANFFSYEVTDCGPEKRAELEKSIGKIVEERKKYPGNVEITRTVKNGCETFKVNQSSVFGFWNDKSTESESEEIEESDEVVEGEET
jgi:hypothetical protein